MWQYTNLNPAKKNVGDCVVRAICLATGKTWLSVYDDICLVGRQEYDMPNADVVWGRYLHELGFEPFILPNRRPQCVTINQFCQMFPRGTFIIGTGSHAVAVVDGDYYDSWDSGDQIASYFWRIR